MSTLTCFSLSIDNHIAHLVLNRPQALNTMNTVFWRELDDVLVQLNQGNAARVLVISSTGKHFSAGMSLDVFGSSIAMDDQTPEGRAAIVDMLASLQATFTRLEDLRIPVIVALHGGCIGGAVDFVTAACLRYASADSFFCIQEINIGMVADVGTLQRLPKLMPMAVVKELAYTGRRLRKSAAIWFGQRRVARRRQHLGRSHASRTRNCQQTSGGHLGHQTSPALRTRPQHSRCFETNGLAAKRHLEQRPCARSDSCVSRKTSRRLSRINKINKFLSVFVGLIKKYGRQKQADRQVT